MKLTINEKIESSPESGFSLIEIILVIAIMGTIYAVALPNLGVISQTESSQKIQTLGGDIRAAFDMAVLNGKSYRLAFHFPSGDYWLETTDREKFYLGDAKLERDLSPEEVEDEIAIFKEDFEQYKDIAGTEINIPDSDRTIKPTSPLIKAESKLLPASWSRVKTSEWGKRSLGPYFVIQDMQAEHHANLQRLEDLQDKAFAYLYFFPKGYVEKAVIHLGVSAGDYEVDRTQEAITVTTVPNEGFANTEIGYIEVDIQKDEKRR
jgi:general secretion pathway protein H